MMWALNESRSLIEPSKGARAKCPGCEGDVIAKCGTIYVWHWAHVGADCDPWSEPESPWHRKWKSFFPIDWQEQTFVDQRNGQRHRADVADPSIGAIEFQNSSISAEDIHKRECFYLNHAGAITWVVNAKPFIDRLQFTFDKDGFVRFTWLHARKVWADDRGDKRINTYFDLGGPIMLHSRKMGAGFDARGWGHLVTKIGFLKSHKAQINVTRAAGAAATGGGADGLVSLASR